jgi:hypothetical protein
MGMMRCDVHGLTYLSPCCEHVADAVDAGRFERAHVELNGWAEPTVVCDGCVEETRAQDEAAGAADLRGWFFELTSPSVCCGEHLAAWYAATGQGALLPVIRDARVAAGIEDVCEVHGENRAEACCVHVAGAVKSGGYERAYVEVDGWGHATSVCEACLEQTRAQRAAAPSAGEPWLFQLQPRPRYACGAHVHAWYVATGQGERVAEIREARRAAGFIDDDDQAIAD